MRIRVPLMLIKFSIFKLPQKEFMMQILKPHFEA